MKYLILSVLLIFASINITKTTFDILQSSKRLEELQSEVTDLDEKKLSLQNTIDYKKSDEYVQEKGRNELNLILPGEKVYVVVGNVASSAQKVVLGTSTEESALKGTNVYHWYRLFF